MLDLIGNLPFGFWHLDFDIWTLFGIWILEFEFWGERGWWG
jgi:hypothetical protein